MYVLPGLNNCARAQKTINTSKTFKSLRSHCIIYVYYEVKGDNAQRQFIYFIIAIYRKTLKNFLSQFL